MSDNLIPIRNRSVTPFSFVDSKRPLNMVAADNVYKKLASLNGGSDADALEMARKLVIIFKESSSHSIDEVWGKIEKRLYNSKSLSVPAKTDEAKVQTAFGLLYNALNTIDATARTTVPLQEFRSLYTEAYNHVESRILPSFEGTDKSNLTRTLATTSSRLKDVVARFNKGVEARTIGGPTI